MTKMKKKIKQEKKIEGWYIGYILIKNFMTIGLTILLLGCWILD